VSALGASAGLWTGKAAQWDTASVSWDSPRPDASGMPLECEADAGDHGADAASSARYAANGDNRRRWSSDAAQAISWASEPVTTLYHPNYLNWANGPGVPGEMSRLDVVKSVGTSIAYSLDGLNLGLMRFSSDTLSGEPAEGGMVMHAMTDISQSRDTMAQRLQAYTALGYTPLSETLYEAGQYLAGRPVDYGLQSTVDNELLVPSVPESRRAADPSRYESPVQYQCQKNFVVLLTDGEPTADSSADDKIANLPGFGDLGRSQCDGSGEGHCLDDMAEYLHSAADLAPGLPGRQGASVYTIGFGPDVAGSTFLDEVARRGGGKAFKAGEVTDLTAVLRRIFSDILQSAGTFAAPSVAVNAFNRTQSNNELLVALFRPADSLRWHGNVKKYGLRGGEIVDATGVSAVDPATGFLRSGTRSMWSSSNEADVVMDGGAVEQLPDPVQRHLYTYTASANQPDLTAAANAFAVTNVTGLTDAVLRTGGAGPSRQAVIDWAHGTDSNDRNGNGDRTETLRSMGDPLHARPSIVTYGGTTLRPDVNDSVAFVPTNDGFLHALDTRSGRELWAFIPPELLGRVADLYRDPKVAARTYGLDSDVQVLKFDVNQDGIVDAAAGDRVWIFFGMRRGGHNYYALDVTERTRPRLKWNLGPAQLPGIGETWSVPSIARVRVQGATQNGENLVLIFGGGYDDAQENVQYTADNAGNRIYMVDASSGDLLWYAGGPDASGSPDLALPNMTHSIPGRIVALDTDGDAYADRLYAADMGGRVWRFDIWNGRARSELVTGGVFARLGLGDSGSTDIRDNRRFYAAPDVALIERRGAEPYYNIAIGSGYRGHPLHTETRDRFYSLRDKNPFGHLPQDQYDAAAPLVENELVDMTGDPAATPVPTTAAGWKLEMRLNGGWIGEKILAEATTVSGTILFTSYQPQSPDAADPCRPATGINRVYALSVDTGRPAIDFNEDAAIDAADRSTVLAQSGIAGEVSVALEAKREGQVDPNADALGRRGICSVGVEVLKRCIVPGGVVRTFWRRSADNGGG
jgi:type IV pilus assembly protein PilY1